MTETAPIIRHAEDGEQFWFAGGGLWTTKIAAAETGGAFALLEDFMVRGKTTPLHVHPNFDEVLYVLDGEILVHIDGEQHRVAERGLALAPRGVPHAFLVTSETARVLGFMTPGHGESFLRAASEPATDANANRPPDLDWLREVAESSESLTLLGPPPFSEVKA